MKLRHSIVLPAVVVCAATVCAAQSLGDVARQERARKSAAAPAARRVITNDDISALPKEPAEKSAAAAPSAKSAGAGASERRDAAASSGSKQPSAAELQAALQKQRQKVASAERAVKEWQQEMDTWKGSDCTHVINTDTQRNACDDLQKTTDTLKQARHRLEQEQAGLETLKETARKLGYRSSFYEKE